MTTPLFLRKILGFLKRTFLTVLIGLGAGLLGGFFLHSLNWVTQGRLENPSLILGLPLVGLLIPWLYQKWGAGSQGAMGRILEEIHRPQQVIPWAMAPLIYLCTLLSHGVGASVGREGTALQMSASFADQLARWLKIPLAERGWVLMAALSGGFSAALGAPWAGWIFGLEVITVGRLSRRNIIECFISSVVAWFVSVELKAPHFKGMTIALPPLGAPLIFHLLGLALILGLVSRVHVEGVLRTEKLFLFIPPRWRTGIGGALLLGLYWAFPLNAFQGLGLGTIHDSFHHALPLGTPFIKLALTILSLAVGFKGGEFIPLVFIGSSLASALSGVWQEPTAFFAALGMISLFGAAAKTPLSAAILTAEFFGWSLFPYALLVALAAFAMAGPFGIYPGQGQPLLKRSRGPWRGRQWRRGQWRGSGGARGPGRPKSNKTT